MSHIYLPRAEVFLRLPVNNRKEIFRGGVSIAGDDNLKLAKHIEKLRKAAALTTKNLKPAFTMGQRRDFDERTVVTVVADGATLHANILSETQRALQNADRHKAFELGKSLAEKGWRVALPGYNGICESVIEGVRAGGGHYIVAMEKRSLKYDDSGKPLLPENEGHGIYIVTNTLAESKSLLFAISDRNIYLPGGLNTLDMYTDNFTLEQTGSFQDYRITGGHRRRFLVLNDDNYWKSLPDMTDHMIREGFADEKHRNIGKEVDSIESVIRCLEADLYDGMPWPAPVQGAFQLFVSSLAITLAGVLSRSAVIRQLVPATANNLKTKLDSARIPKLKGGSIDPIFEAAINNPTAAVYCGSRNGKNPIHMTTAKEVGQLLRDIGYTLIYGGSRFGIMGAVADGYLESNSTNDPYVLAVTPFPFLLGKSTAANEGHHPGITVTIAAPSMHERKILMTSLSSGSPKSGNKADATVMLSGGWGSLDEVLEEIRLGLMGVTHKKIIIFDIDRYWQNFTGLFEKAIERGYMRQEDLSRIVSVRSIPELRAALLNTGDKQIVPAPSLHKS